MKNMQNIFGNIEKQKQTINKNETPIEKTRKN